MEATVSWNAYIQMKNSSVADMMGSARAQHVAKNVYYMKTSQRDIHLAPGGKRMLIQQILWNWLGSISIILSALATQQVPFLMEQSKVAH